jgi:hypothetical protein
MESRMADAGIRIVQCEGKEFWSEYDHNNRKNTGKSDSIDAMLKVDQEGNVVHFSIREPGYFTEAESKNSIHFTGDYEDKITYRNWIDQGIVRHTHYKDGTRHFFIGEYEGKGYKGICYIELTELEA